jgi:maleylpyruvate isomerase
VHLNRNGGEQFQPKFREMNPQQLVPVLSEEGVNISQSLAILEYLEEKYPQVPLLPKDSGDRAYVRQLSLSIACEIHPLCNLRVLKFLTGPLGLSEDAKNLWIKHWIETGLAALEAELARSPKRGRFCYGDSPTLADLCLVPQVFNAQRFAVDMKPYPTIMAIDAECQKLPAFQQAHPAKQPDSE